MKKQQMPQKKNPSKPALRKKARKAGADDVPSRQPFLKRLLFGEEKPDLTELESGSTTILDILVCTPSSRQRNNLHFTHENPSCIPYG
uniref:hypothetical protein n=1 Tax=Flavonifractor plautii TaxID=292800 RepID=UPI001FAC19C3